MAAYTTDQHIPANAITEVLSRSSDGFNKYQNKYVSKTLPTTRTTFLFK